ncbi:MAG: phosphoribosyl-ATP diphosphatase [Rhizobiaceae bacterium]
MTDFTLEDLNTIILSRAGDSAESSYTALLLAKGTSKCAEKLGEEAVEAVIAAASGNQVELKKEAADVLYHLLVLLKAADVSLADVMMELDSRTNQSGLQEKASRKS